MATISLRFKWATFSPDPHDRTMRSNLEPCDVYVVLDVPLQHEYIANAEAIIQGQLAAGDVPLPVLTLEGMKFCANALSLAEKPKEEPDEDFDWDDEDGEEKEAVSSDEIHDDDNWDEEW